MAAYRIATYNAIAARGLERLGAPRFLVGKALADPDAILLRSHVLAPSEVPRSVLAVARAGAGVNNIPVDEMSKRGIPVFNAPGANANAVKELVLAAMLLAARHLVPAAAFAQSLPGGADFNERVEEVLRASDFVSLHVPLNAKTRHMIGAARLEEARPGLVLLNFSRDAVVDEAAVVAAVESKRLGGYVCDFPSPALQGRPGIVALPHLGASTGEAEENCAVMVAEQLRQFLEHGTISNAVNFPAVEMARESPHRIAIANANVPNMVGQISTTMAQAGLNIHNMVNKSRGEMAYTLVDLDSSALPEVIQRISRIPGVLSVRDVPLLGAEGA